MEAIFKMKLSDLNDEFLGKLKELFVEGAVEIKVHTFNETSSFIQGVKDLEEGKVVTYGEKDFFDKYESLLSEIEDGD